MIMCADTGHADFTLPRLMINAAGIQNGVRKISLRACCMEGYFASGL